MGVDKSVQCVLLSFLSFFLSFFFFSFLPRENGAQSEWTSGCPTDCTVRDGSKYLDGDHWLCATLPHYSNSKQMRFSKEHLICWIKLQADLKIVWHDFKNNVAAKYKIVVWYLILLSVLEKSVSFFFFFWHSWHFLIVLIVWTVQFTVHLLCSVRSVGVISYSYFFSLLQSPLDIDSLFVAGCIF